MGYTRIRGETACITKENRGERLGVGNGVRTADAHTKPLQALGLPTGGRKGNHGPPLESALQGLAEALQSAI